MNKNKYDTTDHIGPWSFDPSTAELQHNDGHMVRLEEKIANLLTALINSRGKIVTKEELIDQVWDGRELSEQTIPVAISKLRKALGDDINKPTMLETIPRQGYRLLAHSTATRVDSDVPAISWHKWAAVILPIAILSFALLRPHEPAQEQIQFLNADKPHVIVTINDVRVPNGNTADTGLAISVSELAAYYLAQTPDLLVIRHWWNLDAPDPTGGIYTRYGAATPVYSLKGTLHKEGKGHIVTFVLSDPKTDEIIWSGLHAVESGSQNLFPMFNLMLAELPVDYVPTLAAAPEENAAYWRARYFYELSNPGAARIAASELDGLITPNQTNPAVNALAEGLIARWQDVPEVGALANVSSPPAAGLRSIKESNILIDQATRTLFAGQDPNQALELAEEAIAIAPGDHFAHSIKAEALAFQGRIEDALAAYRLAFRLAPYAKAYEARMSVLADQLNKPQSN